jgi:hypothetical protein
MAESINVDKLAAQIARELKMFSGEVVDKVNVSSERVGKEAVKMLKKTSPKDSGEYAKGWKMTTFKAKAQPDKRIIHNKNGQLTHLLENGHAKVNGGRVEGIPHIRPAEEMVIKQFVAEVEEAIERG